MRLILISLFLFCNLSFAEEPVYLQKGEDSPYNGYLLSREKVLQILETKDLKDLLILEYTQTIKQNENLKYNLILLKKQLISSKSPAINETKWYVVSFLSGVLFTYSIFFLVLQSG